MQITTEACEKIFVTLEDVLSHENVEVALSHFATKRNSVGPDGLSLNNLPKYWKENGERITLELAYGTYQFGIVRFFEKVNGSGKKRSIASINVIDRFVERLVLQVIQESVEQGFSSNCFAFLRGKGTLQAAMRAREFAEAGCRFVCEIDIKDFFDSIPHDNLGAVLHAEINDKRITELILQAVKRYTEKCGRVVRNERGLLQGAPLSPILSNMYLREFDRMMDGTGLCWFRFADNIYVYTRTEVEATAAYNQISEILKEKFELRVNAKKSGVFKILEHRVLGYDFYKGENGIDIRLHCYQPKVSYQNWHPSVAFEGSREVHIIQDGVLNKQDYSLIFENESEKHLIPVEVVDQLNIYGDVCIAPQALATLNQRGIKLSYFDKYGNLSGVYMPESHNRSAQLFLKQCELYGDEDRRFAVAQDMELAFINNMRMALQYYRQKLESQALAETLCQLSNLAGEMGAAETVAQLMLIEARAHQLYYGCFDEILQGTGFCFEKRTRRPPRNELNAMISFGNTLLYNRFLQIIWKTPLDPKIGVVHATNRRDHSLNLDFADLFKPIVVDRTIFGLVNHRKIKTDLHFRTEADGSVLMNDAGKRLFISAFEDKLATVTKRRGTQTSYGRLLADEVDNFRKMLEDGTPYKAYRNY